MILIFFGKRFRTIPQALLLMNSEAVSRQVSARPGTMLGNLLAEVTNDRAVQELYLKTLSRRPNRKELATNLSFIPTGWKPNEAFEDILWHSSTLPNSRLGIELRVSLRGNYYSGVRNETCQSKITIGVSLPTKHLERNSHQCPQANIISQAATMQSNATSRILLWMGGGPSQLDTDPKPGSSKLEKEATQTALPGVQISDRLPETARTMKEICLLRGMHGPEGSQRASYWAQTGYLPSASIKHPTIGSHVSSQWGTGCGPPFFCTRRTCKKPYRSGVAWGRS